MYVTDEVINTIVIEKSRFITYIRYVRDEDDYREYLSLIRKKHYDATHVCSACIIGSVKRSSDDGEPSGTAGAPMLNVLEKKGLDHTCALVVRYFGGVKLGAGGLVRAYGNSVSEALSNAVLAEEYEYKKYAVKLNYDIANKLQTFLRNNAYLLDTQYDEQVTFIFALEDDKLLSKISEYTKGLEPEYIGTELIEKVIE